MKAIVYTGYGSADVAQCVEVQKPTPSDKQVLIRIRAASVNAPDWRIMAGNPSLIRIMFGLRKPRIRPGIDVAGRVEAVGKNVTQFRPGDDVFGSCRGAFAEYGCAAENTIAIKPESTTFEQAACVAVCGMTALQGLRDKGHILTGQRLLINGASGGVGTFAVQIAKAFGAHVTAVCSAGNAEMVRSIGADRVIDYNREDFTQSVERYDMIFDCVGNHSLSDCKRVVNPKGICVIAGAPKRLSLLGVMNMLIAPSIISLFSSQKFVSFIAKGNKTQDLTTISDLMLSGKVIPVIDRRYPLAETAEALRYVEKGHARGKVVITV